MAMTRIERAKSAAEAPRIKRSLRLLSAAGVCLTDACELTEAAADGLCAVLSAAAEGAEDVVALAVGAVDFGVGSALKGFASSAGIGTIGACRILDGRSNSYIVSPIPSAVSVVRSRSGVMLAPQFGQKAFSSGTGLPHFSQLFINLSLVLSDAAGEEFLQTVNLL
jgi:hypothetical protein